METYVEVFSVKNVNYDSEKIEKVQRGKRFDLTENGLSADVFVIYKNRWNKDDITKDKVVLIENKTRGHGSIYRSPRKGFKIAFVSHYEFDPAILPLSAMILGLLPEYAELEEYLKYGD